MGNYSMPGYFQNMPVVTKPLRPNPENEAELKQIEAEIEKLAADALAAGKSDADMNAKGQMTAMQRVQLLVDEGTWCPLNTIYNPADNKTGSVSIVKGLGRVNGKWCMVIASDNKKHAGTWVPGQADDLLRGSDLAKRLRIPLVYLLNCAGVELDQQEQVYANRRGGGTPFYRNAELNQLGVPVIVGIYGTNPAGGGYHSISPTILIAHQKANMAVGGAGIVGGMNPKGYVDLEGAEALIKNTAGVRSDPPGSVSIHYNETGFFREVYAAEEGVVAGVKKYLDMLPAYDLEFFRVADPAIGLALRWASAEPLTLAASQPTGRIAGPSALLDETRPYTLSVTFKPEAALRTSKGDHTLIAKEYLDGKEVILRVEKGAYQFGYYTGVNHIVSLPVPEGIRNQMATPMAR